MSKPEADVLRKKSPRRYEDKTLRGTRHKSKPILVWVTLKCVTVNHFLSISVLYIFKTNFFWSFIQKHINQKQSATH